MSKEGNKMIKSISNVTNSKDIEIIISDILNNNPVSNDTFYNDDENENLIELIFHIYKQYNTINDAITVDIKEYIEELLLQHIKVAPPMYNDSHLKYLEDKLTYLENIPQPEQRTPEWYVFRNNRLTASDLYHITSESKSKIVDIVKKKCGVESNYSPGAAILHGVKFEPVATKIYEDRCNIIITEFGCLPHPSIPFFGASPDGICSIESKDKNYVGRMLEIKCPKSRPITGIIPPVYFAQVQGQLEVCDLEYCDFLECELREYNNKKEFFEDVDENNYLLRKNGNEKGVMIEVYDMNLKKTIYFYNYDNFKTLEEFKVWEDKIIDEVLETENYEYNTTTYWKLTKFNVVLVKRNREWFNSNYIKIYNFWQQVLEARRNNTYLETEEQKQKKTNYVKKYDKNDDFEFLPD
jgi:putative phage-type endonuclease